MLKLEKVSKSLELSITFRKQARFFNRTLIQALALAIGLHLLAFFLFHVSAFKVLGSHVHIPPVNVETDIFINSDPIVTAQIAQDETHYKFVKEPRSSSPAIPSVIIHSPLPAPVLTEKAVFRKPFEEIKSADLYPIDFLTFSSPNSVKEPIQVYAFGLLAHRISLENSLIDNALNDLKKVGHPLSFRASFAVKVDDQTGSIFWYESKHQEKSQEMELLAEQVLKSIHFTPYADSFVSAGDLEIHFYPERLK